MLEIMFQKKNKINISKFLRFWGQIWKKKKKNPNKIIIYIYLP